ncbi:hypothetical protein GCM10015535_41600 [Streptomyces gelaticus]|uniref:Uncharacterized protein n=1 Tax=Streptomyces gelaticus TaxID=285446 RepID=A0ABQ2W1T9_9ACTN|nr:hypothetical protein [Streptomyces gelaticus]GGV89030.1 hypothetical protein GCM10015535_41600 [Streptomyces gelaticus]
MALTGSRRRLPSPATRRFSSLAAWIPKVFSSSHCCTDTNCSRPCLCAPTAPAEVLALDVDAARSR